LGWRGAEPLHQRCEYRHVQERGDDADRSASQEPKRSVAKPLCVHAKGQEQTAGRRP